MNFAAKLFRLITENNNNNFRMGVIMRSLLTLVSLANCVVMGEEWQSDICNCSCNGKKA